MNRQKSATQILTLTLLLLLPAAAAAKRESLPRLLPTAKSATSAASGLQLKWSKGSSRRVTVEVGTRTRPAAYGRYRNLKRRSLTVKGLPDKVLRVYVRLSFRYRGRLKKRSYRVEVSKAPSPSSQQAPLGASAISLALQEALVVEQTVQLPSPDPLPIGGGKSSNLTAVWANDGGDKITRDELRATGGQSVKNSVWDGDRVTLFGARNEVVGFNLALEAGLNSVENVSLSFDQLTGPNGFKISSKPAKGNELFDWTERDIELFYVRYLQIKGLSRLSYENYDERHIPARFRRPFNSIGIGTGSWLDRPDHDKFYPDVAVPLELKPSFDIAANSNQGIWTDIYIPKEAEPGTYQGEISVREQGELTRKVPVQLEVRSFSLPDQPTAKTMVFFSQGNVSERYTGEPWPEPETANGQLARSVRDQHFKLAHRHKLSLIDGDSNDGDAPKPEWQPRLDGSLFTGSHGYRGPGEGIGNGIYSIGTYGTWSWKDGDQDQMWNHTNAWVNWFEQNAPTTDYFLYLIDESSDYEKIEQWADWVKNNPGPGKKMKSFATMWLTDAVNTPSLDIPATGFTVGDSELWQQAVADHKAKGRDLYFYNGKRPANGSFATEDDGVALRELAWAQYKKKVDRWFFWESTYYNDYQGGRGQTNVFQTAQTFGSLNSEPDDLLGETGWNHSNGDGVLFYPGTDKLFPEDSYGTEGPLASLRLKQWRRGIQDVDYLALAAKKDQAATQQIVDEMVPKALWEYGIDNPSDPTYVRSDISWSIDPNKWEAARKQLAEIIEQ